MNELANIATQFVADLTDDEVDMLNWDAFYQMQLRRNQKPPPGDWLVCLMQAGRGFGKTLAGASWVVNQSMENPRTITGVMSPTHSDLERVMWSGPSGIWSIAPTPIIAGGNPGKSVSAVLTNGTKIQSFSGKTPERLRGPQHHNFWFDEPAGMLNPHKAYDQILFGLRLGVHPKLLITSTPKPIPLFKRIAAAAKKHPDKYKIMRGSTMDNMANLSEAAVTELRTAYEGTRLGRQELYGELLEDFEGALWMQDYFLAGEAPNLMDRVVVAVDPSGASSADSEGSDEIGIVVAGTKAMGGGLQNFWVMNDASILGGPATWARKAVSQYYEFQADCIVAESNYGGAMVSHAIHSVDESVPVRMVRASRGKHVRAEPVAILYEQGRVYHTGNFAKLVDQLVLMTSFGYMGEGSPDRADALVWALSELNRGKLAPVIAAPPVSQTSFWRGT